MNDKRLARFMTRFCLFGVSLAVVAGIWAIWRGDASSFLFQAVCGCVNFFFYRYWLKAAAER